MDPKLINQFIDQLKSDTIDKTIKWIPLNALDQQWFEMSENLQNILYSHAHSIVLKQQSYRAEGSMSGFIYLITRRSQSQKDGTLSNEYALYVQPHELDECSRVPVASLDLIELATIVKNVSSTKTTTSEKEAENYITNYLSLHSSQNGD